MCLKPIYQCIIAGKNITHWYVLLEIIIHWYMWCDDRLKKNCKVFLGARAMNENQCNLDNNQIRGFPVTE